MELSSKYAAFSDRIHSPHQQTARGGLDHDAVSCIAPLYERAVAKAHGTLLTNLGDLIARTRKAPLLPLVAEWACSLVQFENHMAMRQAGTPTPH